MSCSPKTIYLSVLLVWAPTSAWFSQDHCRLRDIMGANTFQLYKNGFLVEEGNQLRQLRYMDSRADNGRVQFDVSGQLFTINKEKITNGPKSKLKSLYLSKSTQRTIYIDRVPVATGAILGWYQTGELHIPMSLCPGAFLRELEYWDIKHTNLTSCCFYRLKCFLDEQETLRRFQKAVSSADDTSPKTEYECACPGRRSMRARVWSVMDYGEKSCASTAYFILTVLMIMLSILVPAYMTDPMFQRPMTNCERLRLMKYNNMADIDLLEPYLSDCSNDVLPFDNVTSYDPVAIGDDEDDLENRDHTGGIGVHAKLTNKSNFLYAMIIINQNPKTSDVDNAREENTTWKIVKIPNNTLPVRTLVILETITAIFFLFDFALRIFSCPNVVRYFKSIINVSDAVSLVGILVHTFMLQFYSHKRHYDIWVVVLEYLQMLRSFRLFRIVKNVKASRVLIYSVFQNIKDLSVLGLFLVVGTCIFASILYVCEDDTTISSIPVGWYWALVTMTTVGYGDVTPKTTFGRFFACLCATSGVLLFALTVPIFTNHFIILYQYAALDNAHAHEEDGDVEVEHVETEQTNSNNKREHVTYKMVNGENDHVERFV